MHLYFHSSMLLQIFVYHYFQFLLSLQICICAIKIPNYEPQCDLIEKSQCFKTDVIP